MADLSTDAPDGRNRLISWKRIAQYLGCSERTARRWRDSENLPVHAATDAASSMVFAFRDEIDAWLAARPVAHQQTDTPDTPGARLLWHRGGVAAGIVAVAITGFMTVRHLPATLAGPPAPIDRIRLGSVSIVDETGRALPDGAVRADLAVIFANYGLDFFNGDAAPTSPTRFTLDGAATQTGTTNSQASFAITDETTGGVIWARSMTADRVQTAAHGGAVRAGAILQCIVRYHQGGTLPAETVRQVAKYCDAAMHDEAELDMLAYAEAVYQSAPTHPTAKTIYASTLALAALPKCIFKDVSDTEQYAERARMLASEVLRRHPTHALAQTTLDILSLREVGDDFVKTQTAIEAFDDDDTTAFMIRGYFPQFLYAVGRQNEAMQLLYRQLATSPYDGTLRARIGVILAQQNNDEMAYGQFERAMRDQPDRKIIPWLYLESAMFYGAPDDAKALITGPVGKAAELSDAQTSCFLHYIDIRQGVGVAADVIDACDDLEPWHRLRVYAAIGEHDRAFDTLNSTWPDSTTGLVYAMAPEFSSLRGDPRFWRTAERLGLLSYWDESGALPDFCAADDNLACAYRFAHAGRTVRNASISSEASGQLGKAKD